MTGDCPDNPNVLAPCECKNFNETHKMIYCPEYVELDVVGVFKNLSQALAGKNKQFYHLRFFNKLTEKLPANVFADIEFQDIWISDTRIDKIDENAFNGTKNTLTKLTIDRTPIVDANGTDDNDLFKAIRQLPRLTDLEVTHTLLTEIPDGALQSHPSLIRITLSNNYDMRKIGKHAFSDIKTLFYVTLEESDISFISDEAFSQESAELEFIIRFMGDDEAAYLPEAFQSIKRPVNLHLTQLFPGKGGSNIPLEFHYIPESTYRPFLDQHPMHRIFSMLDSLDCDDKRNDWLRKRSPNQWFDEICHYK
ncbi:unnamed protein product [Oppiella nova]|uniref:Uncharacterized protein n=1 Tax=Oppiella nova TaxID=334625 RepID=A0A7R9QJX8_9ACAR|nr:unnamed protein product [Oppiella nova]CAG2167196.1 unnamed protein product [Oppiella nova]